MLIVPNFFIFGVKQEKFRSNLDLLKKPRKYPDFGLNVQIKVYSII